MTDARMALSIGSDLADRLWIRYGRELSPPGYAEVADALFLELLRPALGALDPGFMRLVVSTRKRLGQER